MCSTNFILEAFKNEFALPIFVLPDALLGIILFLLAVEHVVAEIEHCFFVHFRRFTI